MLQLTVSDVLWHRQIAERAPGRRALRASIADGTLVKVHHGWYSSAVDYENCYSEEQHLTRVRATARAMRGGSAVYSHHSAAVLWQLPLFRVLPRRVHTTMFGGSEPPSSSRIMRHRDVLTARHVTERDGLPCTSLARTVVDISRISALETGLSAADAAMRRVAWDDRARAYDYAAAERFRHELLKCIAGMTGRRGIRNARFVMELADGRAQLPGESVSRLYLIALHFTPRLQVEIAAPWGNRYFVDFGLDEVGYWGEFDGESKYTNSDMTGGRSAEEVLRAQDQRQAWITRTTSRPFARWGSEHIENHLTLRDRLTECGIPLLLPH